MCVKQREGIIPSTTEVIIFLSSANSCRNFWAANKGHHILTGLMKSHTERVGMRRETCSTLPTASTRSALSTAMSSSRLLFAASSMAKRSSTEANFPSMLCRKRSNPMSSHHGTKKSKNKTRATTDKQTYLLYIIQESLSLGPGDIFTLGVSTQILESIVLLPERVELPLQGLMKPPLIRSGEKQALHLRISLQHKKMQSKITCN